MEKKKLKKYSDFEKRDFLFAYLIILFPCLQFCVFWVYSNSLSIALSFTNTRGEFTFANFATVFRAFVSTDNYGFNLTASLVRSLIIWVISHGICFPVSLITVYVLACKIRGHYVYRVIYMIPSLIGSIIWSSIIKSIFQWDGPVIAIFEQIGIHLPPEAIRNGLLGSEKTAFPSLCILTLVMGLVGNSPVLTGAFTRVPEELFESAELDGAGFWMQFFKIAIPCVWSTITTLLIFAFCSIFTADCGVFLYSNGTGEPGMSTIGFQLFYLTYQISQTGAGNAAYGYPAALGFTLTFMTLPICLISKYVLEKINEGVEN